MILNKEELDKIAERYVKMISENINVELIIPKDIIIDKSYGRIYFYGAKDYKKHRLAGNGPFLVKNDTGIVIPFGTAMDVDYYIKGYEDGTCKPASYGVWDPNQN